MTGSRTNVTIVTWINCSREITRNNTNRRCKTKILNYCTTLPNSKLCYHASNIILGGFTHSIKPNKKCDGISRRSISRNSFSRCPGLGNYPNHHQQNLSETHIQVYKKVTNDITNLTCDTLYMCICSILTWVCISN